MQMQLDPRLMLEDCAPGVPMHAKDIGAETATRCGLPASMVQGRLAEDQLAEKLPGLEEPTESSLPSSPRTLLDDTSSAGYEDPLQASTYHPNRCIML